LSFQFNLEKTLWWTRTLCWGTELLEEVPRQCLIRIGFFEFFSLNTGYWWRSLKE